MREKVREEEEEDVMEKVMEKTRSVWWCDNYSEAAILSLDDFISAVDEEELLPPSPLDSLGQ